MKMKPETYEMLGFFLFLVVTILCAHSETITRFLVYITKLRF
jgi:hypothetical protein